MTKTVDSEWMAIAKRMIEHNEWSFEQDVLKGAVAEIERLRIFERRYNAVRTAGSLLKIYRYDDPADSCSGDWQYKPSADDVDSWADAISPKGSVHEPKACNHEWVLGQGDATFECSNCEIPHGTALKSGSVASFPPYTNAIGDAGYQYMQRCGGRISSGMFYWHELWDVLNAAANSPQHERQSPQASVPAIGVPAGPAAPCECLLLDKEPSAYHAVKCPRYVADAL